MALAVLMIGSVTSFAQGEFRVQNFATETGNANFVYRGYVFSPQRDVVVTGMWGGFGANCTQFGGAIYNATNLNFTDPNVPHWTIGSVVAEVIFDGQGPGLPGINNTPEYQAFATPVTLFATNYYVIAQGRISGDSGCHFNAESLDIDNLVLGSPIISDWFPNANNQYNIGGTGSPGGRVGNNITGTDNIRVLVGFTYETDVSEAVVSTTGADVVGDDLVLTGLLVDSGVPMVGTGSNTTTTLYFEVADNEDFENSTLIPVGVVTGTVTDEAFSLLIENWVSDNNFDPDVDTYYARAVAINEFGRTDGNPVLIPFRAFPIKWWSIGLLFTSIVVFMAYKHRRRFA